LQHAALQILRKPVRLCGAILCLWRRPFFGRLYAAPHGFSTQYFLDKPIAEPILIRLQNVKSSNDVRQKRSSKASTIRQVVRNIILEDVYVGYHP
jgi:hypothetical protein